MVEMVQFQGRSLTIAITALRVFSTVLRGKQKRCLSEWPFERVARNDEGCLKKGCLEAVLLSF